MSNTQNSDEELDKLLLEARTDEYGDSGNYNEAKLKQLIKDRDAKRDAYVIGEDLDMSNFKEGEPDHYMAMGYNDAKHWSRERAALKEVKK